jgi:hypothetical protein
MNRNNILVALFSYSWMQVSFGRRLGAFRATDLEEIITRHWIKGIVNDLLLYYFLFIYFDMFGVV